MTDDFAYWWSVPGDWVEPPNERRNGWSGMLRVAHEGRVVYVKRQRNHLCRTWRHPFGWPTASREWSYLQKLSELDVPAPKPVFHGSRPTEQGIEAVLVTEELTGFTDLDHQPGLDESALDKLADEAGAVVGRLHRAGLQHSCLYGKHIMVRWRDGQPEVALIDLEKVRRRLSARTAARHDLEQLQRRQSLLTGAHWQRFLETHARAMQEG